MDLQKWILGVLVSWKQARPVGVVRLMGNHFYITYCEEFPQKRVMGFWQRSGLFQTQMINSLTCKWLWNFIRVNLWLCKSIWSRIRAAPRPWSSGKKLPTIYWNINYHINVNSHKKRRRTNLVSLRTFKVFFFLRPLSIFFYISSLYLTTFQGA